MMSKNLTVNTTSNGSYTNNGSRIVIRILGASSYDRLRMRIAERISLRANPGSETLQNSVLKTGLGESKGREPRNPTE